MSSLTYSILSKSGSSARLEVPNLSVRICSVVKEFLAAKDSSTATLLAKVGKHMGFNKNLDVDAGLDVLDVRCLVSATRFRLNPGPTEPNKVVQVLINFNLRI